MMLSKEDLNELSITFDEDIKELGAEVSRLKSFISNEKQRRNSPYNNSILSMLSALSTYTKETLMYTLSYGSTILSNAYADKFISEELINEYYKAFSELKELIRIFSSIHDDLEINNSKDKILFQYNPTQSRYLNKGKEFNDFAIGYKAFNMTMSFVHILEHQINKCINPASDSSIVSLVLSMGYAKEKYYSNFNVTENGFSIPPRDDTMIALAIIPLEEDEVNDIHGKLLNRIRENKKNISIRFTNEVVDKNYTFKLGDGPLNINLNLDTVYCFENTIRYEECMATHEGVLYSGIRVPATVTYKDDPHGGKVREYAREYLLYAMEVQDDIKRDNFSMQRCGKDDLRETGTSEVSNS